MTKYYEDVKETFGGHVIRSEIRPATEEEIAEAARLHAEGKCPHWIVRDEPGWLYDTRSCETCGCGLGAI